MKVAVCDDVARPASVRTASGGFVKGGGRITQTQGTTPFQDFQEPSSGVPRPRVPLIPTEIEWSGDARCSSAAPNQTRPGLASWRGTLMCQFWSFRTDSPINTHNNCRLDQSIGPHQPGSDPTSIDQGLPSLPLVPLSSCSPKDRSMG